MGTLGMIDFEEGLDEEQVVPPRAKRARVLWCRHCHDDRQDGLLST